MDAFHTAGKDCVNAFKKTHTRIIYAYSTVWRCERVCTRTRCECQVHWHYCVLRALCDSAVERTRTLIGCGVIHLFVYVQYKERHRFLREQDIWSWHDAHFLPMMTCIHALWCVDMIVGGVCDWAFTAASLRKGGMMTSSCAKLISLTGRQLSTSASNTFLTASKSPVNASASSCMLEGPGVDGGLVWGRRGIASPGSLTIDQETLRSRSAMQKISHRLPCTEYRRKPGGRHYPGLY